MIEVIGEIVFIVNYRFASTSFGFITTFRSVVKLIHLHRLNFYLSLR
jgi:hypothetical protein